MQRHRTDEATKARRRRPSTPGTHGRSSVIHNSRRRASMDERINTCPSPQPRAGAWERPGCPGNRLPGPRPHHGWALASGLAPLLCRPLGPPGPDVREKTVPKPAPGNPNHAVGGALPLPQRRPQTWHLLFNLYLQTLRSDVVPETLGGVVCCPCSSGLLLGLGRDGCHRPTSAHPTPPPPQTV